MADEEPDGNSAKPKPGGTTQTDGPNKSVAPRKVYTSLSKSRQTTPPASNTISTDNDSKGPKSTAPIPKVNDKATSTKGKKKASKVAKPKDSPTPTTMNAGESKLDPSAAPFVPTVAPSTDKATPLIKKERKPVAKPKLVLKDVSLQGKLKAEVDQLKRRYTPHGFTMKELDGGTLRIFFKLPITDPDFPFELPNLPLSIDLPKGYPEVGHPSFNVAPESGIPEAVRQRIHNRMDDAAVKMPLGEMNIKPLLVLLERNLEKWMVALPVLASSSIRIIPAKDIVVSKADSNPTIVSIASDHSTKSTPSLSLDSLKKSLELNAVGVPVKKEMATVSRFQPPEFIRLDHIATASTKMAGTICMTLSEVRMEGIALVIPIQLAVAFRCVRCRAVTEVTDLRPDVDRYISCTGCKQRSEVHYYRTAIHERSSIIGYLRAIRTTPVELLPSTLQLSCSECSPPDPLANSIKVEGVRIGESLDVMCRHCPGGMHFAFEGIVWDQLPAPQAIATPASAKASKLPTKVGEPLPKFGACEHYKKSFRWFRFPCCGRAYPCDECHAADPSTGGHPAEWASRQICGYCSREFSTSQKYCECGETPGLAVKSTAHWEGGKGTRDQTVMSRKDRKKYRNQEKTVSNRKAATTK